MKYNQNKSPRSRRRSKSPRSRRRSKSHRYKNNSSKSPYYSGGNRCKGFKKTVGKKCDDQPGCKWKVGTGCVVSNSPARPARPVARPAARRSDSPQDKNTKCAEWARRGECTKNQGYMLQNCPKSCKNVLNQVQSNPSPVVRPPPRPHIEEVDYENIFRGVREIPINMESYYNEEDSDEEEDDDNDISNDDITSKELLNLLKDDGFITKITETLSNLYNDKIVKYTEMLDTLKKTIKKDVAEKKKLGSVIQSSTKLDDLFPQLYPNYKLVNSIEIIIDIGKQKVKFIKEKKAEAKRKIKKDIIDSIVNETKGIESLIGKNREEIRNQLCKTLYMLSKGHAAFMKSFLNMIITGPAGTGKTKLAKVISYIYAKSGILLQEHINIVSPQDMIGQYIGQTGPKTVAVLLSGLEGITFIDEAYQLMPCNNGVLDEGQSFGPEAITEIVNFLDKFVGLSILMVAGYEREINGCFIAANEGLNRRFPNRYKLKPYSVKGLFQIFINTANNQLGQNIFDRDILIYIYSLFEQINKYSDKVFINQAGDIMNLVSNFINVYYGSYKLKWSNNADKIKMINSAVVAYLKNKNINISFDGKKRKPANIVTNIQKIYGPVSISYLKIPMEDSMDKKIILMGDVHTPLTKKITKKNKDSVYYDEYMVNIIKRCEDKNQCVDLYLEKDLTKKQGNIILGGYNSNLDKYSNDTLNYIRLLFRNCGRQDYKDATITKCNLYNPITEKNEKEEISNLRLQNIDLRITEGQKNMANIFLDNDTKLYSLSLENHIELLKYILSIDGHQTKEEIKSICPEDIPTKHFKTVLDLIDKMKIKVNKELKRYKKNKISTRLDGFDIVDEVYKFYSDINEMSDDKISMVATTSSIVDLYTLLRMLKNFEPEKQDRGPSLCRQNMKQDKIMVYAGDKHIDCYKFILSKMFPRSLVYNLKNKQKNESEIVEEILKKVNKKYGSEFDDSNPKHIEELTKIKESIENDSINKILTFRPNSKIKNFNELMNDFCE